LILSNNQQVVSSIKIIHKMPKSDEKTHFDLINNGWIQLKEPKTFITTFLSSIPLMFINTLIFSSITLKEFGITSDSIMITI
jgi:hypothetical protein